MNAASLMLSRQHEVRRYASSAPRYAYAIKETIGEYTARYPNEKFDDCINVISISQGQEDRFPTEIMDVKHLLVCGEADLAELERFVRGPLPQCLVDFYARIKECMLVLRYPISIYSPASLILVEKEIREAEKFAGLLVPDEVTLLRLVDVSRYSSCFALRKFVSDGQWRMVVCTDEPTAELQGNDGLWLPEDCEEFDDWFSRVVETDAFPLVKTIPELFEEPLATRVVEGKSGQVT